MRVGATSRYERCGLEDLAETVECSRCDRLMMPTNVDEVSAELIATHVVLDSCYDIMLQGFPRIIVDPVVLDDTHPFRRLVKCLKYPCPRTTCRLRSYVIEEFQSVVFLPLDVKPKAEVGPADALDICVETEVLPGGRGEEDDEFEE